MFNELITFVMKSLDVYILILARILGMMFIAPMFSRNNIPATVKVGLSMIISYIILPFVISKVNLDVGSAEFIFIVIKEGFTGFCLGLCIAVILNIFLAAGSSADINLGLSMAQMVDPSTGSSTTPTGQLFSAFAYLVFFVLDLHQILIKSIVNSFELMPINTIDLHNTMFIPFLSKLSAYILVSSLLLVMPIIITLFLGNILLAFMAKVMPQMNVFVVGMPFKIIVGFSIFYITLAPIKSVIIDIFNKMLEYIYTFINIV